MKITKIYLSIILLACSVIACDRPIIIKPGKDVSNRVVIDGLITNQSFISYVKLRRSKNFYDKGAAVRIKNAKVTVKDDKGNSWSFVHNPANLEGDNGVYYPPLRGSFKGVVGRTYSLAVVVDGKTYTASETMLPVAKIGSITSFKRSKKDVEREFDPLPDYDLYGVKFSFRDPQNRKDQYLFKFYDAHRNLITDEPGGSGNDGDGPGSRRPSIYVYDDVFLEEVVDNVEVPYNFFQENGAVSIEMYSLTREALTFYSNLSRLLSTDGGMFDPPPANPKNNLSNGALGYFQVSALDIKGIYGLKPRPREGTQ